jgi:hypothetical protein
MRSAAISADIRRADVTLLFALSVAIRDRRRIMRSEAWGTI